MAYQKHSEKPAAAAAIETAPDVSADSMSSLAMSPARVSLDSDATETQQQSRGGFWHELLSELMYLEATTAYWALQAANPADVSMQELQQLLQSDVSVRRSGQRVENEYLTCVECSHHYYVNGAMLLQPCDCGCRLFVAGRHH